MNELYNSFQKYFEIVRADTNELLEIVYRIRYQVLCVEQRLPGFDASFYPDKMERDDYDDHSSHVLLRFRSSGNFIGTIRLILFDPLQPEKPFPIELYTQTDSTICNIKDLPRKQIAEISRSLVVKQFDRRKGERRQSNLEEPSENTDPVIINRRCSDRRSSNRCSSDRRTTPHLSLLLMAGVMRMSTICNIKHWFFVTDPALNRLLGYYGLDFNPIGPSVNYHGIRRPYYVKVEDVLHKMYTQYYDAWEVVTDCGQYNPLPPVRGNILD